MERVSEVIVSYDKFSVATVQESFQHLWHFSIYIAAVYLVAVYAAERIVKVSAIHPELDRSLSLRC